MKRSKAMSKNPDHESHKSEIMNVETKSPDAKPISTTEAFGIDLEASRDIDELLDRFKYEAYDTLESLS